MIFHMKSPKREHPHQDAIHYAGWVSLFTLHALWPFLWIWATLWRKERGWGFKQLEQETHDIHHRLEELIDEVNELKNQVSMLKQQKIQQKPLPEQSKEDE